MERLMTVRECAAALHLRPWSRTGTCGNTGTRQSTRGITAAPRAELLRTSTNDGPRQNDVPEQEERCGLSLKMHLARISGEGCGSNQVASHPCLHRSIGPPGDRRSLTGVVLRSRLFRCSASSERRHLIGRRSRYFEPAVRSVAMKVSIDPMTAGRRARSGASAAKTLVRRSDRSAPAGSATRSGPRTRSARCRAGAPPPSSTDPRSGGPKYGSTPTRGTLMSQNGPSLSQIGPGAHQ
jgi:hypothetical protein